jgi:hypothetical protein
MCRRPNEVYNPVIDPTPPTHTHTHISRSIKTWPLDDLSFHDWNALQLSTYFDVSDIHSYIHGLTHTHSDSMNPRASQNKSQNMKHR